MSACHPSKADDQCHQVVHPQSEAVHTPILQILLWGWGSPATGDPTFFVHQDQCRSHLVQERAEFHFCFIEQLAVAPLPQPACDEYHVDAVVKNVNVPSPRFDFCLV